MTIVSLKTESGAGRTGDSDLNRIELSDGSLFSFRICYLPKEAASIEITEGGEITAAQEEGFRFASACLRAEKTALRLIARAEQSCFGLTRKLRRRGHENSCVSAVITRLSGLNLINDERFAQLWIESRLRLSRSPRRLLLSLCGKGIDHKDAEAALKAVLDEETESEMLARYAKRNLRKKNEQANSLKYLLSNEGFSRQAISLFLNEE